MRYSGFLAYFTGTAAVLFLSACGCGGGEVDRVTRLKIPATDSAASATAMATGRKTECGRVSWEADSLDGPLRNIGDILDDLGWSVGLVTTVPFSHATPACFASHCPQRGSYFGEGISEELIGSGIADLIIGAGYPEGGEGEEGPIYISIRTLRELEAGIPEVIFVHRARRRNADSLLTLAMAGLDPDDGARLVGLFGGSLGCFEPPVLSDLGISGFAPGSPENPTLASAGLAALEMLSRDDQGFFLLLEQGDIDWANHDNDFLWLMGAMWDLETAVTMVCNFVDTSEVLDWDETMVILTSDHANGHLLIDVGRMQERGVLPEQVQDSTGWTYPGGEVLFLTDTHTSELVSFRARFPDRLQGLVDSLSGSPPAPGYGLIDNTHIFHLILGAATCREPVRNIILIVGDGMAPSCEAAAGLFLHGATDGMVWEDSILFPFSTWCTTWDIETYDQRAAVEGVPAYSSETFDPRVGYDPAMGGTGPSNGSWSYFLTPLPMGDVAFEEGPRD